jgi:microsomal epoxide hydrolase
MQRPWKTFRTDVSPDVLRDLHERLERTRWPDEPRAGPWMYGTDLHYMREVVAYWLAQYDWRKWEARLNAFEQYQVRIRELDIHFIIERGSGSNPLPLLITHGWPGSIVEFLDIIEPLAHPERFGGDEADAFTVIAPSLPGYGFSQAPPAPTSPREFAGLWHELMAEIIGEAEFVAQGGDWGAVITSWMALERPGRLRAIHLNGIGLDPGCTLQERPASAVEQEWLKRLEERNRKEVAYQMIQGTKPQTLSYGLTDSPAGLAAWILEKFYSWTIPDWSRPAGLSLDHLLTNVMLYWLNGSNAPAWLYCFAVDGTAWTQPHGRRVEIPTGLFLFPEDTILVPPLEWTQRSYNVVRRNVAPRGGHFAALENGPLLTEDVRDFFRAYR